MVDALRSSPGRSSERFFRGWDAFFFAKSEKKPLFSAKTAVFTGKNGFFADFREKSSAKHAFFLKKIGCVRENIISAVLRSLFAWGRSAVALSVCRSLRVSLFGTLFKEVKVIDRGA